MKRVDFSIKNLGCIYCECVQSVTIQTLMLRPCLTINLKRTMNNFQITGRIGQGAHGFVMKAVDLCTNSSVALKKLVIKSMEGGIPKNIMREITALKVLEHEHIVKLLSVVPHGMGLVVVMEYMPSNLHQVMQLLGERLGMSMIKAYLWQLLEGVTYMHDNNVMHRDLKPTNLLISEDGTLKIADFGLARVYDASNPQRLYSHQVATRWYRAPELLYGARKYTQAIDLWAIGCIAAEMINRTPLFPGDTDIEQLAIVLHTLGSPTEESWPGLSELPDYNKITFARNPGVTWNAIMPNSTMECRNFIRAFINYDENKRLTARNALHHSFFREKPIACRPTDLPKGTYVLNNDANIDVQSMLNAFDEIFKDF